MKPLTAPTYLLLAEHGRKISEISSDDRKGSFLFQQISIYSYAALQCCYAAWEFYCEPPGSMAIIVIIVELFRCFFPRELLLRVKTWINNNNNVKIYKQHSSCSVHFSYFSERVANIWNSLPVDTDFSSLARFIHCINSLEFLDFCLDIKC